MVFFLMGYITAATRLKIAGYIKLRKFTATSGRYLKYNLPIPPLDINKDYKIIVQQFTVDRE